MMRTQKDDMEAAWNAKLFCPLHIVLWRSDGWGFSWAPGLRYTRGRRVNLPRRKPLRYDCHLDNSNDNVPG